ncbi:MAG: signal peptidase I [Thermomicrobiales bacterium]|nr:signal peptidase I [Thermomicrobiales bacterium]
MEIAPPDQPAKKRSTVGRGIAELTRTLILAAIVFVGARTVVLPYEVDGASMSPNLHDQERVLVNRTVYFHFDLNNLVNWIPGVEREGENEIVPFHPPERGDVVVLNPPLPSSQPYIKRIIGLPGESVSFEDGYVYINGEQLDEPYIDGAITRCTNSPNCSIDQIPEGYVYVLGDNRDNSSDSRSFGLVSIEEIVGKAWFTNWPLTDIGRVPHYDYSE